jgi:hypothetical protein
MLPPPCFTVGKCQVSLFSSDQRILFLMVWESCAFYRGVGSVWPLYHKGLIGGAAEIVIILEGSPISIEEPCGSWSPPWPRHLSRTELRGTKKSHDGGRCVLADLQCFRNVLVPFTRSVPQHNLRTIPLTSWLGFFSNMHCQRWNLI